MDCNQTHQSKDELKSIPIIALSAHAMEEHKQRALDSGCNDYDTKPVDINRLLSKISEQLGTKMINKEDANILIVDDIEDNRYTLERRLKRDGYKNIFLAEGGKTALDMATKNKFDLILLDLMMPDMSGLEVLKYLKGDPLQRSIPVIMVTASDEVETAAECIINGADDFITKPFNGTLLKARVGASLEKKRLRDTEESYLDRVETDKKRSQQILKTVMPTSVANELQSSGKVRSRRYDDVAILICDLVGFTSFCEKNDPELVVETLQGLVENFEKAFEDFGLEKIKTVGDAIVAVAGLSSHAISPVKSCVDCSYKLREIANTSSMPWNLHLGIHSGSLVAGTVGTKTVQFDILGKTVNMAFNICDMSDSNQILISSDAWMTARNEIKVKSIGLKRLKSGQDIEMLECV